MKPKLIILLLLIVLVPLGLLAWLSHRVARDERERVRHELRELLLGKLRDVDATISGLLEERERQFLRLTELDAFDAPCLRRIVQSTPTVQQALVLDPQGERIHPPPLGPLNSSERAFLARAAQIWRDKQSFRQPTEEGPAGRSAGRHRDAARGHGWYVWYWGSGTRLLFWRRTASRHVVGLELDRMRLLHDIIGKLPSSDPSQPSLPDGRIVLLDAKGAPIYPWGAYEPADGEAPKAALPLSHPLNAWSLGYYASTAALEKALGAGAFLTTAAGLAVVAVALVGLAVYVYRETAREMREAAQRVSFVNQVSHELKTPLTNIRLYAELLEAHLGEDGERNARYLGVIVSESQRLSRLIANVLTFARKQRDTLALRTSEGCVDDVIRSVLEYFRPSLESKGVRIVFDGQAAATVRLDPDALEQILGNLFANVEKYAASGGLMEVASRQDAGRTTITVADRGPGLPEAQRETVFRPFTRLSSKLTDGATGTGIGLAIARELARLHGGDLTLEPSDAGARFQVVLHTPAGG